MNVPTPPKATPPPAPTGRCTTPTTAPASSTVPADPTPLTRRQARAAALIAAGEVLEIQMDVGFDWMADLDRVSALRVMNELGAIKERLFERSLNLEPDSDSWQRLNAAADNRPIGGPDA